MTEEIYFVIRNTEDGIHFEVLTEAKLKERLVRNEDYEDGYEYGEPKGLTLNEIKDDNDIESWPTDKWLIIKGKVIVPKPAKVVEKYEVE